ncbi:hypothetical protein [Parvularcula sp. LCG005]|uniref:hypothetical protein n=1 Tax=Parvularcula sp. LCG005 TaxID=3078805 RepID=UPI00294386FF|nr:hypothetical protein [Parvularcula sp. LCG005]WOI52990.1 hypothetical protein RUI03_12610 [Parvularcula sp. LCG005]
MSEVSSRRIPTFSQTYKVLAGELLLEYREELRDKLCPPISRDRVSWTAVVKMIMAPEECEAGSSEQTLLTPDDLRKWLDNGGNPVGDQKFYYIARFISTLNARGELAGIRKRIKECFIEHQKSFLAQLHGSAQFLVKAKKEVVSLEGKIFCSHRAGDQILHLLRFGTCVDGVFDIKLAHFTNLNAYRLEDHPVIKLFGNRSDYDEILHQFKRSDDILFTEGYGLLCSEHIDGRNDQAFLNLHCKKTVPRADISENGGLQRSAQLCARDGEVYIRNMTPIVFDFGTQKFEENLSDFCHSFFLIDDYFSASFDCAYPIFDWGR